MTDSLLCVKQSHDVSGIFIGFHESCLYVRHKTYVHARNGESVTIKEDNDDPDIKVIKPVKGEPPKSEEDGDGSIDALGLAVSACGRWLAVLDGYKQLSLWNTEEACLKQTWCLPRRALVVAFTPSAEDVLVADKTGDVYKYKIEPPCESGELLLGHISMLLDAVVSNDGRYLITCDRDEKIRVSCYPNCYNIQSFCLGHKEFITKLKTFYNYPNLLLSASGDGTCRIWNYAHGKCLSVLPCASDWISAGHTVPVEEESKAPRQDTPAVVDVACWQTTTTDPVYIAATLSRVPGVMIYQLNLEDPEEVSLSLLHTLTTSDVPVGLAASSETSCLWTLYEDSITIDCVEGTAISPVKSAYLDKIVESFRSATGRRRKQRDVNSLYKHFYDNMSDYLKRKEEWMNTGRRPTGRGPPPKKKYKT